MCVFHKYFFSQEKCICFEDKNPKAEMRYYHCIGCQSECYGEIKSSSDVCASETTL